MSIRDELTGLYNRRYFNEAIEREIARAVKHKTGLSLCMIDLDHFKETNDQFGHSAGDKVLVEFAKTINTCLRRNDLCCRYGGEEFILILPGTDIEKAYAVCERIRLTTKRRPIVDDFNRITITVSIGIVNFDSKELCSPSLLITLADKALYKAKATGRDRVVKYEGPLSEKGAPSD